MSRVMRLRSTAPGNGEGGKNGGGRIHPRITEQPQSMHEAAQKGGMFLYTDDAWSLRYFKEGDLHCRERMLFGKGRSR
jgi:hypothetical protein